MSSSQETRVPAVANPIRFRRNIDIGAADAENDDLYLEHCFIDTGDVSTILDCENSKCIILGRTGVGKTALIKEVHKRSEHWSELSPEALSLQYIANSNVLRFFEEAGVHLDIFYSLLWRHIMTVELLKLRFNITNEDQQHRFYDYVKTIVARDRGKERALKYLSEWGDKFWTETEYRITEFTKKLENDLKGSVKIGAQSLGLGAEGARRLTAEEKVDVRNRGMEVVNAVQVKELHDVIGFLADEVFRDRFDRYHLIIDRLDESWVDDKIRFKLIKALIEAVRTFKRVHPVKIVIALRTDLLYRLVREASDPGFQEEKYRSLYLRIRWSRQQLVTLLDNRVTYMFERQYTRQNIRLGDIMPTQLIQRRSATDYILDRTFQRPREAIIFLNECIMRSEGASRITIQTIRQAELSYSQQRLTSAADEWRREYPSLIIYSKILERRSIPFKLEDIPVEECEKFAFNLIQNSPNDEASPLAEEFYTGDNPEARYALLECIFQALYHVGIISVKLGPQLPRQWSLDSESILTKGQLKPSTTIDVHKTFHAALGVILRGVAGEQARR